MSKATTIGKGALVMRGGKVRCNICRSTFEDNAEYLNNSCCDNANCRCPRVRKAMEQADQAIETAKNNPSAEVVRQVMTLSVTKTLGTLTNDAANCKPNVWEAVDAAQIIRIVPIKGRSKGRRK